MTTPESIEAMLVSSTLDPRVLLANVRAVIVDEVSDTARAMPKSMTLTVPLRVSIRFAGLMSR